MKVIKKIIGALVLTVTLSVSHAETLLKDLQGHTISFSSLKGKWVLINYWASWCKTCVEEIPELNRFYRRHAQDPVALYAVNYDGLAVEQQNELIKFFNIQYPSLLTNPAQALQLGDIIGVPVTFVFNPQGKLVHTLYGGQNVKSLEKVIRG